MTGKILDIEKWKTEYPFLKEVSKIYDELDKTVEGDPKSYLYDILCDQIIKTFGGEITKHKGTCMKLVRNLGFYTKDSIYFNHSYDRCNILYNWIYNSIEKDKITNVIIKNCYDDYIKAKNINQDNNTCIYHSYKDDYIEPENIMLLNVFKSYINVTKDTMNGENNNLKHSCHKYICEFVKIYKKMYSTYCLRESPYDQKQKRTCELLRSFKYNYNFFLFKKQKEYDEIPYLDDDNNVHMNKCKLVEHRPALPIDVPNEPPRFLHSIEGTPESLHTSLSETTVSNTDPNTSISSTVSTAVGTVAGASSILALLYKFSPGGNLIRFGIRGSRGRISSNLYEEVPNDILFNGFQGEDLSSYNTRYNIGYGSV